MNAELKTNPAETPIPKTRSAPDIISQTRDRLDAAEDRLSGILDCVAGVRGGEDRDREVNCMMDALCDLSDRADRINRMLSDLQDFLGG